MTTLRINKSPMKGQNVFRISIQKNDQTHSDSHMRIDRLNKTLSPTIALKNQISSPSFFVTKGKTQVPKLELPDIKVPSHTPKTLGNVKQIIQPSQVTYSELLRQQAEQEKKKEEALYLSKAISQKVENLAIELAGSSQRELRSQMKKSFKIEDPVLVKKPDLKPLKPERIKTILGKVKSDMTAAGLSELLTSRSNIDQSVALNQSSTGEKTEGNISTKRISTVQFVESIPKKDPRASRKTVNFAFPETNTAKHSTMPAVTDQPKSAKERLITSIQSINHVNDSLKSYASTFLNQMQDLSEYNGKHKRRNPERMHTQMTKKQAKILLSKKFRRVIWYLVDKMKMLKLTMTEVRYS